MMKKLPIFLLVMITFHSWAQEVQRGDAGAWAMLLLKTETASGWKFSLESHERTWGFFNDQALTILRPAVHFDLSDHVEAAVGTSWVTSPPSSQEWNVWEQLTVHGGARDVSWSLRIRDEQRLLEQGEEQGQGQEQGREWVAANRLRVRFTVKRPLLFVGEDWYTEGFAEWWLSQDSSFRTEGMQRTWHTLSVGRKLGDDWSVQLTALQQRDAASLGWNAHLIGQVTVIWNGGS
jgi:hypothetical protein